MIEGFARKNLIQIQNIIRNKRSDTRAGASRPTDSLFHRPRPSCHSLALIDSSSLAFLHAQGLATVYLRPRCPTSAPFGVSLCRSGLRARIIESPQKNLDLSAEQRLYTMMNVCATRSLLPTALVHCPSSNRRMPRLCLRMHTARERSRRRPCVSSKAFVYTGLGF